MKVMPPPPLMGKDMAMEKGKRNMLTQTRTRPAAKRAMGGGKHVTRHERPVSDGREVWHITADGRRCTLVTTASSVAAMDEAVHLYVDALTRLAKR